MSIPRERAAPEPGLYVVGTPIGNLEDISPRCVRILSAAGVIFAEDTRHTRALLSAHDIHTPLRAFPAYAESRRVGEVVDALGAGGVVALCTDAGMPGVSDPGAGAVRAARDAGHSVTVIPGPSAVTTALAGSGWSGPFTFLGFLPRTPGKLRRALEAALDGGRIVVFFESPLRLATTLRHAAEVTGERPCVVARELTKLHETWHRGTAAELAEQFRQRPPKGECTVVVGPA